MIRRLIAWLTASDDAATLRHIREQSDLNEVRRLQREQAKHSAQSMIPPDTEE